MAVRKWWNRLQKSSWFNPQTIMVSMVLLFVLGLIVFSGGPAPVNGTAVESKEMRNNLLTAPPASNPLEVLAVTPTPTVAAPGSDLPQTDGVVLCAALVILVIVGGTLFSISRKK